MSDANKLIDKILSEAQAIAATEAQAAKVKADEILQKAKKKIKSYYKQFEKES